MAVKTVVAEVLRTNCSGTHLAVKDALDALDQEVSFRLIHIRSPALALSSTEL